MKMAAKTLLNTGMAAILGCALLPAWCVAANVRIQTGSVMPGMGIGSFNPSSMSPALTMSPAALLPGLSAPSLTPLILPAPGVNPVPARAAAVNAAVAGGPVALIQAVKTPPAGPAIAPEALPPARAEPADPLADKEEARRSFERLLGDSGTEKARADVGGGREIMRDVQKLGGAATAAARLTKGTVRDFKNILVLVAMDVERDAILSQFDMKRVRKALPYGLEVHQLVRGDIRILLATTGVGVANAAIATAILSEKLAVDAVLLLGVGGSLSPSLDIGDMVIGTRVLQHDCRFSGENGCEMMAPGELHLSKAPSERSSPFMAAHPIWIDWLKSVLRPFRPSKGTVLSGNEFAGNAGRKMELAKLSRDALMVDMEAAGVAQVARKLGLPLGVVKTVSDRLNPDGSVATDYKRFLEKAAEQSRHIFERLISATTP